MHTTHASAHNHPTAALCAAAVTALALTTLMYGTPARADDSEDRNFVRIGAARLIFHDQNTGFQGPLVPGNVTLGTQAENHNALTLTYARGFTPHLELEFIGGIPPEYKAHARGSSVVGSVPYAGVPLVSGHTLSPAATLNYKFNEPGAFYRPYVGAGMVYTHFYDIQGTAQGDAVTGGPTRIHFSDTFGLIVVAGVSFRLADHLYGQLSMSHADVNPDVTTETAGITRTNHVSLSPVIFSGQLSYGF